MIYKKETGITLIALVVTIIVLLILAGITISIALDNGGLISRTRDAAATYSQAEKNDVNTMDKLDKYIEGSVNENYYDPDEWIMAWTYSEQNRWSSTITDHNTNFSGDILAKLYEVGEEYHLTIEKIGENGAMGTLASKENSNNEYKLASINNSIKLAGAGQEYPQAWKTVDSTYDKLTKVVIKDGVTNVGKDAFSKYSKLKTVVLPESIDTIGRFAFSKCSALTNINLSNVKNIETQSFEECTSLSRLELTNCENLSSTAFRDCTGLIRVNLPKVKQLTFSFSGCSSLQELTISENCTSIDRYVLRLCNSMTSFYVPSSVRTIGEDAFVTTGNMITIKIDKNDGEISGAPWIGNGEYSYTEVTSSDNYNMVIEWKNAKHYYRYESK